MLFHFNVKNRTYDNGFSLIELLIVLLIAGLLSASSIIYWGNIIQQNRADYVSASIHGILNRARLYSMEYWQEVVVCGINVRQLIPGSGAMCSSDWTQGIGVFLDQNQDRNLSVADTLLEVRDLVGDTEGIKLLKNNKAYFVYRRNGALSESAASVFYCPNTPDIQFRRSLVVNNVGRVRVEKGADISSSARLCN